MKKVITLSQVEFHVQRDLPTNDWLIRIPDEEMIRHLMQDKTRIVNVAIVLESEESDTKELMQ